MTDKPQNPGSSTEVRDRLVEALNLDLVGPWVGHPLGDDRALGGQGRNPQPSRKKRGRALRLGAHQGYRWVPNGLEALLARLNFFDNAGSVLRGSHFRDCSGRFQCLWTTGHWPVECFTASESMWSGVIFTDLQFSGQATVETLVKPWKGSEMEYSVMLDSIDDPGFEGYYYAHIPALELTTQGKGIDGALSAAKELAEVWIAEKCARGESVPQESNAVIARIEIPDAVLSS